VKLHQIIGALILITPYIGIEIINKIGKERFINFIKDYSVGVFFVLWVTVGVSLLLSGCTTTKTIEVPVPVPCTKPKNIPVPHDYVADLNKQAGAAQFVPACLASIESYKTSYNACMLYHEGSQ
jgi:hypothetical protein